MTIAACFISPEGVVLGADSTTTFIGPGGNHYFNHAQKLFEIGEESTLGVVTWGLGSVGDKSHRTLLALLADDLKKKKPKTVDEVAARWADQFWSVYEKVAEVVECQMLAKKKQYDPAAANPDPAARTKDEENRLKQLDSSLGVGFCIAGYLLPSRLPAAVEVSVTPHAKPTCSTVPSPTWKCWGAPNLIQRIMFGYDEDIKKELLASGKWQGTEQELMQAFHKHAIAQPLNMPIRDAIDFVHATISTTIKGLSSHFFRKYAVDRWKSLSSHRIVNSGGLDTSPGTPPLSRETSVTSRKRHQQTAKGKPVDNKPVAVAAPEWLTKMHEYHSETGLFRSQDVAKVLGDPIAGVSGEGVEIFDERKSAGK